MSEEISQETSKRICSHMNEDHAASVYGMVMNLNPVKGHVSNCKMKSISLQGCELSYVICRGDMCEQHTVFSKFSPPLGSVKEARPRLIELHHEALTPKVHWLVTDPVSVIILIAASLLAYGTYGFGTSNSGESHGLATAVRNAKRLNHTITSLWGSPDRFAQHVVFFWYFTVTIHALEGGYVAYHSIRTLKLRLKSTMMWFYLVVCTGFPIANRFFDILKVHTTASKGKESAQSKNH